MRTLSAPVILSSIVLGGCLAGSAMAQDTVPGMPPANRPSSNQQTGNSESTQPGVIPQPTIENPGLVLGIKTGLLYTDNVRFKASDQPRQSSWITSVQPFIKAAYDSPRFSGLFDYTLSGFLYSEKSDSSYLAHHLDTQGTLTAVPRHLFIDGSATYSQQIINNRLPAGSGRFFQDNNQANVATASISPYWLQGLGRAGTLTLRYAHGRVMYNRHGIDKGDRSESDPLAGIPDVNSDKVEARLVSPEDQTWGWDAMYVEQRLTPDSGAKLEFATASVGISRRISPRMRLLAHAGRENRYLPDGTVDKMGAGFWNVGMEWTDARNRIEAQTGHRFYGRSARLSWMHTAALLTWNLRYEEKPTDLNRQLLGQHAIGSLGLKYDSIGIPSLVERRVYLMKRAVASLTYLMPAGQLNLTLSDEKRDYFLRQEGGDAKVAGADISWRFNLGAFTTLTPGFTWRRYRFQDGQVNYRRYLQLEMVHQFNPSNFLSVQLRRDSVDTRSQLPTTRHYRANTIYVNWTHLF